MIEDLTACFDGLVDPRVTRQCDHRLIDILVIAVSAVIACAESWEDIELYGRSKQAWLKSFLALPNGIPSHDTFRRVLMLVTRSADLTGGCGASTARPIISMRRAPPVPCSAAKPPACPRRPPAGSR